MSQPAKLDPGRVDHLAKHVLRRLSANNPLARGICRFFEEDIDEMLEEEVGPGTKAHEIGRRMARVFQGDK